MSVNTWVSIISIFISLLAIRLAYLANKNINIIQYHNMYTNVVLCKTVEDADSLELGIKKIPGRKNRKALLVLLTEIRQLILNK